MSSTKLCPHCKTETPSRLDYCQFCGKTLLIREPNIQIGLDGYPVDDSFSGCLKRLINTFVFLVTFGLALALLWWIFGVQLGIEGKTLWVPATIVSLVVGIAVPVLIGIGFDTRDVLYSKHSSTGVTQDDRVHHYSYTLISFRRIIFMTVISYGFYLFYWFYITWKHYRDHTGRTAFPVWHALTLFVPIYGFFRFRAHMIAYRDLLIENSYDDSKSFSMLGNFNRKVEFPLPAWSGLVLVIFFLQFFAPYLYQDSDGITNMKIIFIMEMLAVSITIFLLLKVQSGLNKYWRSLPRLNVVKARTGIGEILIVLGGLMVWSMSMLATFAPDNEIGKDLLQDYTVGWSEFWSENVKDVFDHSYEVRLGDCVDFNGDLVECDSRSAAYRVLNSFRILESNIPKDLDRTRLLMFPSSEVLEKYAAKCSLKASSTFHPSKDSWEDGDRRYLCVRGIDEEESDITQSYIFSRVNPGVCLNDEGIGVQCDSNSAEFVVLMTIEIPSYSFRGNNNYPSDDDIDTLSERCSLNTTRFFMPMEYAWRMGDIDLVCARSIDEQESDITQMFYSDSMKDGMCLNDEGIGVQCDSNSAEFYILKALTIVSSEGSNEYPNDSTLRAYDEKCPSDTEFVFSPTRKRWSVGDRNFMCVRRK